jgi:zinc protease
MPKRLAGFVVAASWLAAARLVLSLVLSLGLVLGLVLAPPLCGTARAAADGGYGAVSFTLANGLQVVVIPNHRVPAVTQMVWYKAGAADELPGKSGIAHFLEHLMFKGTGTVGPGMFSRIVAQNGGRDNAFTAEDYTVFHQTVAADRLELVMKMEADRMANLVLGDAVVLPEREVILEERRSRIDNNPAALLNEQTRAALYLNHHYRIPTIGWESEMEQLSTADALEWYHRWYHPNNAVLVVAGDVTVEQVRGLAETYYGAIPAVAVPARVSLAEPPRVASSRLEFRTARVAQAQWIRSFLAPSYTGGESKHAYALQVLSEIVGGGATSRLNRSLVIQQKLALGAGTFYDPRPLDLSTFGIYATPRAEITIAQLETAIEAEVAKLLEQGVSEEEVNRAKTRMQAEAIYDRDSLSGPADIFGAALATGRTIADVDAWPERIGKVTADEVNAAAKFVIRESEAVTGVLLPEHPGGAPTVVNPPLTPGQGRLGYAAEPWEPTP